MHVYFLPGQGADHRLFQEIKLDSTYTIHHIELTLPDVGQTMHEYARVISKQIDTSEPFILIGVSLGGMVAAEMSTFLKPEKVILISSAKSRKELPYRYRILKGLPIYKVIPANLIIRGALIAQPIVEPDCKKESELFDDMLKGKSPQYMKRTIQLIMEWEREQAPEGIIHIHGTADHTLPYKHIQADYTVEGGSHMMALTQAQQVNAILNDLLK